MASDEEHDDGLGGRSRRRREVTETGRYGAQLVELTGPQLDRLDLQERLREAVDLGRTITSHIARRRQLAHIDSIIRMLDEADVDALGEALRDLPTERSAVEEWLERLLEGGDTELEALVQRYPDADRQQLRQLMRNARKGGPARERLARALEPWVD
jgi:ribosome-associated protein